MDRKRRNTYRGAFTKKRNNGNSFGNPAFDRNENPRRSHADVRKQATEEDSMMGFEELSPGSAPRVGWLVNMVPSIVEEPATKKSVQAVDLFFIGDDGEDDFRATIIARPYLYVSVQQGALREAEAAIRKNYRENIADISTVQLEDISAPNHLASETRPYFLKVECFTTGDLFSIREGLQPYISRNMERTKRIGATERVNDTLSAVADGLDLVLDIREYDVAPVNRLAIDKKINVGYWYRVSPSGANRKKPGKQSDTATDISFRDLDDPDINESSSNEFSSAHLEKLEDIVERATPVVLAYDIECTKKPLKFPDADSGDKV